MSITARVSADEVTSQVTDRFVGNYCEARLIDSPGTDYTPGTTNDTTFLGQEVEAGTAGYTRQVFSIVSSDVSAYTDGGVGIKEKASIFAHDGGSDTLDFTHVALVWSDGNAKDFESTFGEVPTSGESGTYSNIPVDFTDGNGQGMTVDLVIINDGASASDWALTVNRPGFGYESGDVVKLNNGTLAGLFTIGTGDLRAVVDNTATNSDAGKVLAVAKPTTAVSLTAGNEAVFYWNIKLFGFFSS